MNCPLVLFAATLIAVCCLLGSVESLHCYQCSNVEECKKPIKVECSATEANNTIDIHLTPNYKDVHISVSSTFECYNDRLATSMLQNHYKGCIYSGQRACHLTVLEANAHHRCSVCNTNNCNPADRASPNLWSLFNSIVMMAIAKFISS